MKNIESELDVLLGKEGGYVNDPKDSGGETNWGVTKFVADSFGYTGSMKDMTREQAKEIYRARYWIQPKFDKVFVLSPEVSFKLFDIGVNMGQGTAVKFLQRSLNVLNNGGTLFPDMTVDGGLGNVSLKSLETYLNHRKEKGSVVLLRMLNALQATRYIELAESRPKDESFLYGWILNRVGE